MSSYVAHERVRRKVFTVPTMVLIFIAAVGLYFLGKRMFFGLGAVTNLNDGFPWGIWIVYDIVIASAFACGGYVLALVIYVLNKGQYHPLVRAALLTSMFGYALAGLSAIFDMGRYFNLLEMLNPLNWNFNSVMLEVAICVSLYTFVLIFEFLPTVFEGFGATKLKAWLEKGMFVLIALGATLPTMHQSSLGSMMIAMGEKIYPLWQSLHLLPLMSLITAIMMGLTIVMWEGAMSRVGMQRDPEKRLMLGLGKLAYYMAIIFVGLRVVDLFYRGAWSYAFEGTTRALFFWLEMAFFAYAIIVLSVYKLRNRCAWLISSATALLFGGALYRTNAYLIGWVPNPGDTIIYFPSVGEVMVSLGLVAIEVLGFVILVKLFPVYPALHKHAQNS
jgi:Ni/Fe-hydrogenase subunit HybB-like protein